jgi:hypothetical protein
MMNFASNQEQEDVFHQDDLIKLAPYGISVNADNQRPILLLRDEKHEHTLPVSVNSLEAGMALTGSPLSGIAVSPHKFTQVLLESLKIQALQCVFVQIKGAHQFVRIYFQGHPSTNSLKLRADEAMSLCLHLGIPIFASLDFIARSKLMTAEIEGLGKGLKSLPQIKTRSHLYIQ